MIACKTTLLISLVFGAFRVPAYARPKGLRTRECDLTRKQHVCHFPPGNPANCKTLCINKSEDVLADHLAHGDIEGICPTDCIRPDPCVCGACLPDGVEIEVPATTDDWLQGPYTGEFKQVDDSLVLKGSGPRQGNLAYSKLQYHMPGSRTEFQFQKYSGGSDKYWFGILGVASVYLYGGNTPSFDNNKWYNAVMDVAADGSTVDFIVTSLDDLDPTEVARTTVQVTPGVQQKALLLGMFHANFNDNYWGEETSLTIRNWKTTAKPACPFASSRSVSYNFDDTFAIELPFWAPDFSSEYWSIDGGTAKGYATSSSSNPPPTIGYPMYMNIQDDQGVPASQISFAIQSDGPDTYAYMHFFVGARYGNGGKDPSTEDRSLETRYLFTNSDSNGWMEYTFPLNVFPDDYTAPYMVGWYVDPKPYGAATATMWIDDVTLYWD